MGEKMREPAFKNTFAPAVEGDYLPLGVVIQLLHIGLRYSDLPTEVQKAVDIEMDRRKAAKEAGKRVSGYYD
jgi:hypothetical protein